MVVVVANDDFPKHRVITLDDIIRQVAAKPGFSTGVDMEVLKFVWCTFCEFLEQQLLKSRGIVVPGFAHIQLKSVVSDALLWGVKTILIPSFSLLPVYAAAHALRMMKLADPVVKATRSSVVSFCAIATASGLSKAVVANGIKDITHRIGLCAQRGWRLNIDCGFCRLVIEGKRYAAKWNSSFNAKVADIARRINNKGIRSTTYSGTEVYQAADTMVNDVGIDTSTLVSVERHIEDNRRRKAEVTTRKKFLARTQPDFYSLPEGGSQMPGTHHRQRAVPSPPAAPGGTGTWKRTGPGPRGRGSPYRRPHTARAGGGGRGPSAPPAAAAASGEAGAGVRFAGGGGFVAPPFVGTLGQSHSSVARRFYAMHAGGANKKPPMPGARAKIFLADGRQAYPAAARPDSRMSDGPGGCDVGGDDSDDAGAGGGGWYMDSDADAEVRGIVGRGCTRPHPPPGRAATPQVGGGGPRVPHAPRWGAAPRAATAMAVHTARVRPGSAMS